MRPWTTAAAALLAMHSISAAAEWSTPESRARWSTLVKAMFGRDAHSETAAGLIAISAPETAQDAAVVPVALHVASAKGVKELDLVVDENPSPVAARIHFGAAGDPRMVRLRVRVDAFTNMHAVAVLQDGRIVQDAAYVQGAGGCSAPMGAAGDAAADLGTMRMKFPPGDVFPGARMATLMIRHPNFNGMQMDGATKRLVPARYIKSIVVERGDETVFSMATDISLSANPVIEFLFRPSIKSSSSLDVVVVDSSGKRWAERFAVPAQS